MISQLISIIRPEGSAKVLFIIILIAVMILGAMTMLSKRFEIHMAWFFIVGISIGLVGLLTTPGLIEAALGITIMPQMIRYAAFICCALGVLITCLKTTFGD